ncbi:MAG: YbfB/YjiJ family MFS transporter [Ideonella sp.]|nr:YbfB/YjiJ family MFS transporter [Ideonella sp.]
MSGDGAARDAPGLLPTALALALAAAVSLGLARFAYALLLPPMHADLGWRYLTAGLMNTANAAGYLAGALLTPLLLRRIDARALMLAGGAGSAVLLAAHGAVTGDLALGLFRTLSGATSAASLVAGAVLAARLAGEAGAGRGGLVLGLYYGGTGLGIVAAAWIVPPLTQLDRPHAWQTAWWAIGAVAAIATWLTARGTRALHAPPLASAPRVPFRRRAFAPALVAYLMFGIGYIGYMTFIVTLLRAQGLGPGQVVAFYTLLGVGVVASSWLWAGLLQRHRGGVPMALLNGLLALATALPVLGSGTVVVFVSGALFGSVFLSLVASTTALVRHNLPPAAWAGGIAVFTIVFAAGQIVGPGLVGLIADGPGGLERGLLASAVALALGSAAGALQRPLRSG